MTNSTDTSPCGHDASERRDSSRCRLCTNETSRLAQARRRREVPGYREKQLERIKAWQAKQKLNDPDGYREAVNASSRKYKAKKRREAREERERQALLEG